MHAGDVKPGTPPPLEETVESLFDAIVTKPATLSVDATLRDAVEAILRSEVTRKAYVVDGRGVLKGTITVETLMRHVANRMGARPVGLISWFRFLRDMGSDRATDFMANPVVVRLDTPIVEIVRRVVEEHLNDFPVVDDRGAFTGEVNTLNLLRATKGVFDTPPSDPSG